MLDRAPLEVVPPYLRTMWRGLDSGRLKGGSMGTFPVPRVPRDKLSLLFLFSYFLQKRLFSEIYCLPFY